MLAAAAGDGRLAHRQISWESPASSNSSNIYTVPIKCNIALLDQPLRDIIKKVLMQVLLIVVRLYHQWVTTSWVDPSENHIAD